MDMQGAAKYLLDIREFLEGDARRELFAEAFSRVDETRREKAGSIRQERSRAASLGAGLLLQLAVEQAEAGKPEGQAGTEEPWKDGSFARYTVTGLLKALEKPRELSCRLGEKGKPYLRDYPYFFNLSHSGDYVVCVLSRREIGVDIQAHRAGGSGRIAEKYFSPEEAQALLQAKDRDAFFFRLWTRKEAYGKLTGRGIADCLGKNLWSGVEELCWEEYDELPGYSMAVCQYRQ